MNFLINTGGNKVLEGRNLLAWVFSLIHFLFPSPVSVTCSKPVNSRVMGAQERQARSNTFMLNSC